MDAYPIVGHGHPTVWGSRFESIGKPEPLCENLSGFWSRRIDDTHRLVYAVDTGQVTIVACRYHF